MTSVSAEQQLERYKAKLGVQFGSEFHFCRQQLFDIASQWDLYITLFGHSERVSLLNGLNGQLAAQIQRLLLRSVVLGLLRLLDPVKSVARSDNLTLRLLIARCDKTLQSALNIRIAEINHISVPLKKIRNKILAHNDYDQAIGNAKPLSYISQKDTTKVLTLTCDLLNVIDLHYFDSQTFLVPTGDQGGRSLLIAIHYSNLWKEYRKALMKSGGVELTKEVTLQWPSFIDDGTDNFDRYKI